MDRATQVTRVDTPTRIRVGGVILGTLECSSSRLSPTASTSLPLGSSTTKSRQAAGSVIGRWASPILVVGYGAQPSSTRSATPSPESPFLNMRVGEAAPPA